MGCLIAGHTSTTFDRPLNFPRFFNKVFLSNLLSIFFTITGPLLTMCPSSFIDPSSFTGLPSIADPSLLIGVCCLTRALTATGALFSGSGFSIMSTIALGSLDSII